jgi:hypothetical protein
MWNSVLSTYQYALPLETCAQLKVGLTVMINCVGVHNDLVYDKSQELMDNLAIEAFKASLVCSVTPMFV